MKYFIVGVVSCIFQVFLAAESHGHHSFTVYDMEIQHEYTGIVKELRFRNPHISMKLSYVKSEGIEEIIDFPDGGPASMFIRNGLKPAQIKPGSMITVIGSPRKDNPDILFLRTIIVDDETYTVFGEEGPLTK